MTLEFSMSGSPDVIAFVFGRHEVRAVLVDGEPHVVAADVCRALGIANGRDAVAALDDDEKGVATTDTLGGPQRLTTVNEPGLYSLIFRSRKAEAKEFKRWVTHEVLPALRKTGTYSIPQQAAPAELSPRQLAELVIKEADRADAAEQRITELEPAADAWTSLYDAQGDYGVADAAKVLSRDPAVKVGRDRLFTILRDLGWCYRDRSDGRHRIYQTAIETGRLTERPSSHYHPRTGELIWDPPQVRVTVKGLEALHRHLKGAAPLAIEAAAAGSEVGR